MQSFREIPRVLVLSISVFLDCAAAPVMGQPTCPGAPDEYAHGDLTVLEGPAFGGSGNLATGMDATVAVDQPEEGPARFIVGWRNMSTPLDPPYSGNRIYLSRFLIDGTCIEDEDDYGPQYISEIHTATSGSCVAGWPTPLGRVTRPTNHVKLTAREFRYHSGGARMRFPAASENAAKPPIPYVLVFAAGRLE